jgi:hypothetical protein
MVEFPDANWWMAQISDSLDLAAAAHSVSRLQNPAWFCFVAGEISKRVDRPGLKSFARGKPGRCAGTEFMFDFVTLLYDVDVPENESFPVQAAIIGEIEWNWSIDKIDEDFEKLLVVDSIVCFMTIQQTDRRDSERQLNRLETAVRRRQSYARQRGVTYPPMFLLSCYNTSADAFIHRSVG